MRTVVQVGACVLLYGWVHAYCGVCGRSRIVVCMGAHAGHVQRILSLIILLCCMPILYTADINYCTSALKQ